jgi:hypothetical protein
MLTLVPARTQGGKASFKILFKLQPRSEPVRCYKPLYGKRIRREQAPRKATCKFGSLREPSVTANLLIVPVS